METLIEQDFEFNKYSLIYGQFLAEVHESLPDIVIEDVSQHHPYKDRHTHFVSVSVPERLAVVLKLRFGAHLRVRPPPKPKKELDDDDFSMKTIKYNKMSVYDEYMKKREYEKYKEELFLMNHITSMSYPPIIKVEKPRVEDKSDRDDYIKLYNELKAMTLTKFKLEE